MIDRHVEAIRQLNHTLIGIIIVHVEYITNMSYEKQMNYGENELWVKMNCG